MMARIDYFCLPPRKARGVQEAEIHTYVELPFVPSVGMMLKVTPHGNYLKVADVMFDVNQGGEGLVVGIEEPEDDSDLRPWPEMEKDGWTLSC